jgi:uncharacterized membrane protein HdeD (DUF308 family)
MELKYYGKPWLQAFKGGFLIILGIFSMLQVYGTIHSLAMFFSFFIGITGFVLVVAPILLKERENRGWNIGIGIINLLFALALITNTSWSPFEITWIMMAWIVFNGLTEMVEAAILLRRRNAFAALFVSHALLSLLLGYALRLLMNDFSEAKLFNIGLIAVVFGLINELSALMLKVVKKPE